MICDFVSSSRIYKIPSLLLLKASLKLVASYSLIFISTNIYMYRYTCICEKKYIYEMSFYLYHGSCFYGSSNIMEEGASKM